jgi:hypothetical protein
VIRNGPVDLAAGLDFVAGSQVKININERARRVRMQFALALPEIGLLAREAESGVCALIAWRTGWCRSRPRG